MHYEIINCTVMCLPDIHLGPDIVFFVLIPGRGVICIIVQLKYQSLPRLDKQMQEDAHSTLEPSNFYREKVRFLCSQVIYLILPDRTSPASPLKNGQITVQGLWRVSANLA